MAKKNKGDGASRPFTNHNQNDPTRTANGRFAKGHCPNPNGRPRKERPDPSEVLLNVLSKEMPLADGTAITTQEYLAMRVVNAALQDPRLALDILREAEKAQRRLGREGSAVNETPEDDTVLQGYREREERRRLLARSNSTSRSPKRQEGSND